MISKYDSEKIKDYKIKSQIDDYARNLIKYSVTAFLLCGRSPADKIIDKDELKEVPVNNKAFLKLGGKPMVDYVLKAFLNSNKIGDIYVINHANEAFAFKRELEKIVCSSAHHYSKIINQISFRDDRVIDNIEKTFRASSLKDNEYALIASSDTPLINPKLINDFIRQVYYEMSYDVFVPFSKISMLRAKYPEIKKRSMFELIVEEDSKTKLEGVRTGNMFVIKKQTFIENKELMEYLFENRKKGYLAIAKDIVLRMYKKNPKGLFEYGKKLTRKELSIDDISEIIREAYGISAKGVLVEPEFCIDVDKKKDFDGIKNYF
jgi:GTP:adenosylcobinamide-phosphate guanylyltransferase